MLWSIIVIALDIVASVYGYGHYPEIRIDDDPYYRQFQNVTKALGAAQKERVFSIYRTYTRATGGKEHRCLYSKQNGEVINNTVPFEMAVQFTGLPYGFKYPTTVVLVKTGPSENLNSLQVVHPGEKDPIVYRLIYSTYNGCDVMRVDLHDKGERRSLSSCTTVWFNAVEVENYTLKTYLECRHVTLPLFKHKRNFRA